MLNDNSAHRMVDYVIHQHNVMVPPPATSVAAKQVIIPAAGQFSTRWEDGYNVGLASYMPMDQFQHMLMELNSIKSAQDYKTLYHQRGLCFLLGVATCYISACYYFPKLDKLYKQYQAEVKAICRKNSTTHMSVNYVYNNISASYIRIDMI